MQEGNKLVAIITARGGSKRIPRKNILPFLGRPIISYSIHAALESKLFTEVMVSTDDEEIARIAEAEGAVVPFFRSKENADDFSGTADVIAEVINRYKERGMTFETGCCIYPTAPFVNPAILKEGYQKLVDGKFDVVFPMVKYSYPIQRSIHKVENGKVAMLWPENYHKRSQDLEPVYHDAGQFYWFRSDYIVAYKKLFGDNVAGLEVAEKSVQDIDTLSDWELAEIKYQLLNRK
ncbi:pseudaminic acid cytidylyltransferase [Chitinophaga filiformis]|uniref:pseudaminic acid cytidylyltransferase n=1 Tax=Chitinophaga filiformis TaxID=104663 RepID=UPI001F3900CB|nr:pseudaminic acid cytidylyltransferase [Chitinophaga filiformis]MCF6402228.1 pseudaminic acid cytidylyltransferase [Chitinophaga filiformis]